MFEFLFKSFAIAYYDPFFHFHFLARKWQKNHDDGIYIVDGRETRDNSPSPSLSFSSTVHLVSRMVEGTVLLLYGVGKGLQNDLYS